MISQAIARAVHATFCCALAVACATGVDPVNDGAEGLGTGGSGTGGSSGDGSGGTAATGASGGSSATGGTGGTSASGGSSGLGGAGGSGGSGGSTGGSGGSTGGSGGLGGSGGTAGTGGSGGSSGVGGSGGSGNNAGGAGGSGSGVLEVHYRRGDSNSSDNQLRVYLNIVNDGTGAVPLSEVSVRYWYTVEGTKTQTANIDHAVIGGTNIIRTFVEVNPALSGADHYVELMFSESAGSVSAGGSTGEIQLRINKSDFSAFTESDDWSYIDSAAQSGPWVPNEQITLYHNGTLVWGTEPS